MRLTVLGCRSGMPAAGQCSSSYLVETGTARLLLDCGPGAAAALSAVARPNELDAVIISHLHADHCYDLLPVGKGLLSARSHRGFSHLFPSLPELASSGAATPPVPLYVPRGGRDRLRALAALFPVGSAARLLDQAFEVAFDVREYDPGASFTVGDTAVELHGLCHVAPNCGTRLVSPTGSLAYTGDTGMTSNLVPLARGVDLLLSEATLELPDTTGHGHLSAVEAAAVAAESGVGQLVLTHFVTADEAWLAGRRADARRIFDGAVHVAAPGRQFTARPQVRPAADTQVRPAADALG
jgi:ribonuclease BN (tRNA processing enzyme)